MTPSGTDGPSGFFEQHYDRVYRYVKGMVRNSSEAEDLTQEAFLRAHRERASLRDPGAMLSWLYQIATRVSLDRLRQRSAAAPRESGKSLDEVDQPDQGTPSLQQVLEQSEMGACVQRFLIALSDAYRSVLLLHDVHGLSGQEIAEDLGLPLATVKIRLHRARQRLKASLEEGCTFSCDSRGVLVCVPKK